MDSAAERSRIHLLPSRKRLLVDTRMEMTIGVTIITRWADSAHASRCGRTALLYHATKLGRCALNHGKRPTSHGGRALFDCTIARSVAATPRIRSAACIRLKERCFRTAAPDRSSYRAQR